MTKPQLVMLERSYDAKGNIGRARIVIEALTLNSNFLTPAVSLPALGAATDAAQLAQDKWADKLRRCHADKLDVNKKTFVLHNLLRAELHYCQLTAEVAHVVDYKTMKNVLEGSGFRLKGEKHTQGIAEAVRNLRVFKSAELNENQTGIKWDIPANITTPGNVNIYEVYAADTNDFSTATKIDSVKRTTYVYTNLTTTLQNKVIWIVAKTTAGEGVRSAPLAIKVLGI